MADRAPKLSALRASLAIASEWHFKGEGERDLFSTLLKLLERQ
jgi:hypothetical protein